MSGGSRRLTICFLLLIHLQFHFGDSKAALPAWVSAKAGIESGYRFPDLSLAYIEEDHLGFVTSAYEPYSINGLHACFMKAGLRNRGRNLLFSWSLLDHKLYREDVLSAVAVVPGHSRKFMIGISLKAMRRNVTGFHPELDASCGALLSVRLKDNFIITCEEKGYDFGKTGGRRSSISASLSAEKLAVLIKREFTPGEEVDLRMGIEMIICEGFFMMGGYRFLTDEFSSGILYIFGNWYFGVSWRCHPALGNTFSAGLGRFWLK